VVWLSLTTVTVTGTGASQVIRPVGVVGTATFGQPAAQVTPIDPPPAA
jgi:hypothetical protein